MQKYLLNKLFNLKNISIIVLILVLLINLLLDFSFITNRLGKDFREFTYQYVVPFKKILNLEKKIKELEKISGSEIYFRGNSIIVKGKQNRNTFERPVSSRRVAGAGCHRLCGPSVFQGTT